MGDNESWTPSWEDDDESVGMDSGPSNHIESNDDDDDEITTLLFTAINPPGTVSVSAMMDGRVVRVDLSPEVVRLTESHLAEEITVIATMARRQALAAQHALAARVMGDLGHDDFSTRSYLERELNLPSPQTVRAERSSVFATRYADEHD
jgi:hypothetical protein